MKAFKYFFVVVAFVIALIIGAAIYIFGNLNQIIKEAVETVGPEVTETVVKLNGVDVKLKDGRGELSNFSIGNPAGFSKPNMLTLEKSVLQFQPLSITEDAAVIDEITIQGLVITAEQKGLTTNVQELLKVLESKSSGASSEPEPASSSETDIKLIIKEINFADNGLVLATEKWGEYDVDFPSFQLTDIGEKEGGLKPDELGMAILEPLMKQAEKAVKAKLKNITKEQLEAKLNEAKERVEKEVEEFKAEKEKELEEAKDKLEAKAEQLKEDKSEELKQVTDQLKEETGDVGEKGAELEDKLKEELGDDADKKVKDLKGLFN